MSHPRSSAPVSARGMQPDTFVTLAERIVNSNWQFVCSIVALAQF